MANQKVFEYRGIDSVYIAKVLQDNEEAFVTDTPIYLAPTATVSKQTESNSETHYYDNKPLIVISSEGADTITITVAPPELKKLAMITGKSFDEDSGMFVDGERSYDYWALMYRTKGTDGKYRYVSRLKGMFSIPNEENNTENSGTDTTNTQLTYTGIYTEHEFTKGKLEDGVWQVGAAKGIVVDTRYVTVVAREFFAQTQTPDTIGGTTAVTGVGVSPSTLSIGVGDTSTLTAMVVPSNASNRTVTWSSSNTDVATVAGGVVTGVAAGTTTITVTTQDGSFTDTCTVTVTE